MYSVDQVNVVDETHCLLPSRLLVCPSPACANNYQRCIFHHTVQGGALFDMDRVTVLF